MHGEHGMHDYYNALPDFGARLNVAITGIDKDGLKMVSVKQRYDGVFQWLEQNNVMCLRFEDLINNRDATLVSMLDEIEKTGYKIPTPREKALAILVDAIQPKKSHTFPIYAENGTAKLVEPGKPDASNLLRALEKKPLLVVRDDGTTVEYDVGKAMPPAGKGSKPKPEELALLRQWIADGCPETR